MSTAILCYDLDDHEDRESHLTALQAREVKFALTDFDEWLRSQVKHGITDPQLKKAEGTQDVIDVVRSVFWEHLGECGVEL